MCVRRYEHGCRSDNGATLWHDSVCVQPYHQQVYTGLRQLRRDQPRGGHRAEQHEGAPPQEVCLQDCDVRERHETAECKVTEWFHSLKCTHLSWYLPYRQQFIFFHFKLHAVVDNKVSRKRTCGHKYY